MKIVNKRAKYEYALTDDVIEAGVMLTGAEAKAVRENRADLSQAHVRDLKNELFLINANIPTNIPKHNPTRMRKLLLHRSEIVSVLTKSKQFKLNLVPISLYNRGRFFKLEVGLGKPKRKFEKREDIKKKDIKRDLAQEFRGKDL